MDRNVPAFAVRTDKQSGCCLFLLRRQGPGAGEPLTVVMREALHLPGVWVLLAASRGGGWGGLGAADWGQCRGTQKL